MTVTASTPIELVERVYASLPGNAQLGRERLGRPLTLAEKILINHLSDPSADVDRGVTYNDFNPDRVAMQDATANVSFSSSFSKAKKGTSKEVRRAKVVAASGAQLFSSFTSGGGIKMSVPKLKVSKD